MKSQISFISIILFANLATAQTTTAKCSAEDRRAGVCTDWGPTADISPSQPSGKVPRDVLSEPATGDSAWYTKTWDWMTSPFSSDPIGKTQIEPNVTDREKKSNTKGIPNLPNRTESVDNFKNTFTPTQIKVLVKHNNAIQGVYKAEVDSYESLAKAKADMEPLISEIAKVEKEIQPLAQEADNCRKNPNGPNCDEWLELGGEATTKKLGLLRRRSRELDVSIKTAQSNFDKAYDKYRDTRTEVDSMKQRAQDDNMILAGQIRDFEISLRRADVRNAFQETKFDLMTVDHKLDLLESEFDKQDVGIYMQAKMGRLLTSNLLCKSVKKCVSNEERVYSPEDLRELFKDLNDTSSQRERSREYYKSSK